MPGKACAFPRMAGGVIRPCRRAVRLYRPLTTAVGVVRVTGSESGMWEVAMSVEQPAKTTRPVTSTPSGEDDEARDVQQ
ncbi:hypothetical protein GCM10010269_53640 [Streptomyces humidus]|uniref:Uncharacterized protein n=1 Tax=Streptomyces humidus TaxID=52259 RepID=A0A918G054_9ACTN|nr:hypothetical protein GCM10010269_53640 [Streptomyces humidus]